MGGVISTVQNALSDADKKVQDMAKENLQQCKETAEMIAQNFRLQVLDAYKNPEEHEKWQVSGGRQDREDTYIGVSTSSKPSSDITDGVQSLVQGIFGDNSSGTSSEFFSTAISKMIGATFNVFLGNTSAGSSTQNKFLIIPHGVAFYRVDIYMYKYTFSSEGFRDHYESQTVVYASRGILDIKDLKASELLSYVSDLVGNDKDKIKQWMNDFIELYKLAQEAIEGNVTRPINSNVKQLALRKAAPRKSSVIPEVFSLPGPKALKNKTSHRGASKRPRLG